MRDERRTSATSRNITGSGLSSPTSSRIPDSNASKRHQVAIRRLSACQVNCPGRARGQHEIRYSEIRPGERGRKGTGRNEGRGRHGKGENIGGGV